MSEHEAAENTIRDKRVKRDHKIEIGQTEKYC